MNMFADTKGLLSVDMSVDMDIGLGLTSRLALPTRMLTFLPALAKGMYGWAGPGSSAAGIAAVTAMGRWRDTTMSDGPAGADMRIADLTVTLADGAKR
jgi:hypothetical protein